MAAFAPAVEREIYSSEHALLLLKQAVERKAPMAVLQDLILRACEQLQIHDVPQRSQKTATSEIYLG